MKRVLLAWLTVMAMTMFARAEQYSIDMWLVATDGTEQQIETQYGDFPSRDQIPVVELLTHLCQLYPSAYASRVLYTRVADGSTLEQSRVCGGN